MYFYADSDYNKHVNAEIFRSHYKTGRNIGLFSGMQKPFIKSVRRKMLFEIVSASSPSHGASFAISHKLLRNPSKYNGSGTPGGHSDEIPLIFSSRARSCRKLPSSALNRGDALTCGDVPINCNCVMDWQSWPIWNSITSPGFTWSSVGIEYMLCSQCVRGELGPLHSTTPGHISSSNQNARALTLPSFT